MLLSIKPWKIYKNWICVISGMLLTGYLVSLIKKTLVQLHLQTLDIFLMKNIFKKQHFPLRIKVSQQVELISIHKLFHGH